MQEQLEVIREVTESFRDVAFSFFQFQPMTKLIRDTYDEFVDITLEKIIKTPLEFTSGGFLGKVEFQNVIRMPPFKGEIVKPAITGKLSALRTEQLIRRDQQAKRNGTGVLTVEQEEELIAKDMKERNALMTAFYKSHPRDNWLLPADCRTEDKSYMLSVYADVVIHMTNRRADVSSKNDLTESIDLESADEDEVIFQDATDAKNFDAAHSLRSHQEPTVFSFVKLFEIPLMLGSEWDWLILSGVPTEEWSMFNECNLNPMCNFILGGSEKVFITQIKLAPNIVRCLIPSGVKVGNASGVIGEIRSQSSSKRSSILKMAFTKLKGQNVIKHTKILMISLGFIMRKGKEAKGEKETGKVKNVKDMTFNFLWIMRIYVIHAAQMLGQELEDGESISITLGEFNRYLLDACPISDDTTQINVYRKVVEEMLDTIRHFRVQHPNDREFIMGKPGQPGTQAEPGLAKEYSYIGLSSSASYESLILKFKAAFDAELMSHVEYEGEYELPDPTLQWKPYPKFTALIRMMVKYIKCYVGAKPVDDLNHFAIQEMATAGIELGVLTQKAFAYVRRKVKMELEKAESLQKVAVESLLTQTGNKSITEPIAAAFRTGEWGLERGKKRAGVVQQHAQEAKNSQWSIIRKAAIPAKKQSQISVPRQVHRTGYGIVDPTNTPDSAQVGLVKYFAASVYITTDNFKAANEVLDFVKDKMLGTQDEEPSMALSRSELESDEPIVPVLLNNVILGYGPRSLLQDFKALKRSGRLGFYTEVFMKIESDKWETVEEIHIMTTAGRAIRPLFVVRDGHVPALRFIVPHGELSKEEAYRNIQDFKMLLYEGAVEYVSASEFDYANVAETYRDFIFKSAKGAKYDYIELDPMMGMSIEVATIPFPQLNPNPRLLYGAGMSRQPIGVPNATFMTRQDTDAKILTYPHKPLVTTDMAKIIGLDQQPSGNNVIVGVMSHTGTDEDATVWKKEFFERGGLNGTLYETITDLEYSALAPEALENPTIYNNGVIRVRQLNEEETEAALEEGGQVTKMADLSPTEDALSTKEIKEFADADEQKEWPFRNFGPLSGRTNVLVRQKDVLAAFRSNRNPGSDVEKYKLSSKRSGFIQAIHQVGDSNAKTMKITIRFPHLPKEGDKFANRFAQKGVVGAVIPQVDMPFSIDTPLLKSVTPDVIFSPTSFTSRMTAGMTAEVLTGTGMVTCDTRRIVRRLMHWSKGMAQVEMNPVNDFWLILEEVWVAPDHSFVTIAKLQRRAEKAYLEKTKKVDLEAANIIVGVRASPFFNDYPTVTDPRMVSEFEKLKNAYDTILANLQKKGWKSAQGIISRDRYQEQCIAIQESDITTLETQEKGILFSRLPDKYQIEWYKLNIDTLIPNYLMRFGPAKRYPDSKPHIELGDGTAFRNPEYQEIFRILREKGYSSLGEFKMQNGQTGKVMPGRLFMGPCYWMHLKHLTDSKYQTRDTGTMSVLKRGTTQGGGTGGAVRSGELSHSAMMAHGNMSYLAERFMTASDKYDVLICTACGGQCYTSGKVPKPICETCGSTKNPRRITMPYSGVRFMGIMTAAGQRPHFTTRDHPDYTGVREDVEFEDDEVEKHRITFEDLDLE